MERVYTERRWATAFKNGVEEDSAVSVEGDEEMRGRRIRPRMRAISVGRRADKRGIVNVGLVRPFNGESSAIGFPHESGWNIM